eukprot:5015418-Karenia_brevis.AAC.1
MGKGGAGKGAKGWQEGPGQGQFSYNSGYWPQFDSQPRYYSKPYQQWRPRPQYQSGSPSSGFTQVLDNLRSGV